MPGGGENTGLALDIEFENELEAMIDWNEDDDVEAVKRKVLCVVTGSDDSTVKVWNLESGEQEGTSMEHESEIRSLAVTRDGRKIIGSERW